MEVSNPLNIKATEKELAIVAAMISIVAIGATIASFNIRKSRKS